MTGRPWAPPTSRHSTSSSQTAGGTVPLSTAFLAKSCSSVIGQLSRPGSDQVSTQRVVSGEP